MVGTERPVHRKVERPKPEHVQRAELGVNTRARLNHEMGQHGVGAVRSVALTLSISLGLAAGPAAGQGLMVRDLVSQPVVPPAGQAVPNFVVVIVVGVAFHLGSLSDQSQQPLQPSPVDQAGIVQIPKMRKDLHDQIAGPVLFLGNFVAHFGGSWLILVGDST